MSEAERASTHGAAGGGGHEQPEDGRQDERERANEQVERGPLIVVDFVLNPLVDGRQIETVDVAVVVPRVRHVTHLNHILDLRELELIGRKAHDRRAEEVLHGHYQREEEHQICRRLGIQPIRKVDVRPRQLNRVTLQVLRVV